MALDWMAKVKGGTEFVAIAAAVAPALEISPLCELGNDPLHRAFRNTDPYSHVAQPHFRLGCKAKQNMAVIGEEGPAGNSRRGRFSFLRHARGSLISNLRS